MKIIPAVKWKEMNNNEVIQSIQIGLSVLKERNLEEKELKAVFNILSEVVDIIEKNKL